MVDLEILVLKGRILSKKIAFLDSMMILFDIDGISELTIEIYRLYYLKSSQQKQHQQF